MISNLSYFLGMGWLMFCEVSQRISMTYDIEYYKSIKPDYYQIMDNDCNAMPNGEYEAVTDWYTSAEMKVECTKYSNLKYYITNRQFFVPYYGIQGSAPENPHVDQMLAVVYWAFTTLSTVGFGDYNPRSESERLFCAFIFLAGVSVFSYILGIFIEILNEITLFNAEIDDGDNLTAFLMLMKRFNNNKPLDTNLTKKIENYFDFMWKNDVLAAIDDENECSLLEQLPEHVQDKILTGFLFTRFISKFSSFLMLRKKSRSLLKGTTELGSNKYINSYYTWCDQEYRDFMTTLLKNLRPISAPAKTVLVDELDEFFEITFINQGNILIGYEINKEKRYCIRYKDCCVIGAYGMTFMKRSQIVYAAQTNVKGLFLRKEAWFGILNDNPAISFKFKKNILADYISRILIKVLMFKRRTTEKYIERNDYQQMQTISGKNDWGNDYTRAGILEVEGMDSDDDEDMNEVELAKRSIENMNDVKIFHDRLKKDLEIKNQMVDTMRAELMVKKDILAKLKAF